MTKFQEWPHAAIDLLVGGTPCQSFSIAGLRKGLDDPRGNLMLTYLAIAARYRPRWLVWENVPGVLSSGKGRDFGSLLGGLGELGYGFAYRVLDAQFCRAHGFAGAVPQRRRRVFVVGYLGDWRRAAAVLFERESLCGHTAPGRQTGKGSSVDVAPSLISSGRGTERIGETRGQDPVIAEITGTLNGSGGHAYPGQANQDFDQGFLIPSTGDVAHCLNAGGMGRQDYETETVIAHALRGEGFDASEDGTGRGTPLVPIAFDCKTSGQSGFGVGEIASTLRAMGRAKSHTNGGEHQAVAFQPRFARNDRGAPSEIAYPLTAEAGRTGKGDSAQCVAFNWAVRRLTPRECERLQGFPDDYTAIPKAADGPRYKALGNSMAVNCMRWLGIRIQMISEMKL
jgi:DNA (cytosine-5)-methyltransferase 1